MLELSEKMPSREVFSGPAPNQDNVREAKDALYFEVGEEPLSSYHLDGDLHPALICMMLHRRVQVYLFCHLNPDFRWEYRNLLPELRVNSLPIITFTMNRAPPPPTGLQDPRGSSRC